MCSFSLGDRSYCSCNWFNSFSSASFSLFPNFAMPSFMLICVIITRVCGLATFITVACWPICVIIYSMFLFVGLSLKMLLWVVGTSVFLSSLVSESMYQCWIHLLQCIHIIHCYICIFGRILLNWYVIVLTFVFLLIIHDIAVFGDLGIFHFSSPRFCDAHFHIYCNLIFLSCHSYVLPDFPHPQVTCFASSLLGLLLL